MKWRVTCWVLCAILGLGSAPLAYLKGYSDGFHDAEPLRLDPSHFVLHLEGNVSGGYTVTFEKVP